MPLEPETEIYRAPSKKVLAPRAVAARPSKGKIARWTREKRHDFEREILSLQKPLVQIAKDYGVSYGTAIAWKTKTLQPALIAAQQTHDIAEQSAARQHLSFLFGVNRRTIEALEKGGTEITDPETGEPKLVPIDPRVTGTIAQNTGQGANLVKALGEFTGELADVANSKPVENTVIRVISMPKCPSIIDIHTSRQALPRAIELAPVPEDDPDAA